MSEVLMFINYGIRGLWCGITHHRWVYLPTDDERSLIWDRACTRCYARDRKTNA